MLGLRLAIAAAAASFALAIAPGTAAAAPHYPIIGFGEQRSSVFTNEHWSALGLRHVRLVVGWDALRYRWQRREIDNWMAGAEAAGATPLVAFTRSRHPPRRRYLPSPAEYQRHFQRFRNRYPSVRNYLVWNEANHCSQPLCHKPQLAAAYFDMMRKACWTCTIVAADVLDTPDMTQWLKDFRKAAKHTPRIWGLHNYIDANRFRTTGTREILEAVRGEIWFTETGGLVKRSNTSPIKFPDSTSHAARATRFLLNRLVPLSPRIKRVYLYHFEHHGPEATWDSGILDHRGRPRPAYKILRSYVARAKRARQAR